MQSPLTITYKVLIEKCEARIKYMEKNYPRLKIEGRISPDVADSNIAADKLLLKMLKEQAKDKQLQLWQAYEKVKH